MQGDILQTVLSSRYKIYEKWSNLFKISFPVHMGDSKKMSKFM